jgi:UDP-N-acetylmuramyl pentapeptide phosphotransferase/UDP-N-acetylglucosamine-1-phosphate transferase
MNLGGLGVVAVVFLLARWLTGRLCSPSAWLYTLDRPNERSLHVTPTPRTGGLAVLGSLLVGLSLSLFLQGSGAYIVGPQGEKEATKILWLVGLALFLGAFSFLDDRKGLSRLVRFGTHAVVAGILVWGAGLMIETITLPLAGTWALGWMAAPFTMLSLMWMTNLYNFMDGMDGFAGGMAVVGFGFLSYIAWAAGDQILSMLSLLIAGSAGGFLFYNMPPARIFMGDVGSIPLGFLAGALALVGIHGGRFDIWVPMLIFSPFIVDATVTLFRRLLRGEKVLHAHREHYYQRLALAGWGHRKTVWAEYAVMCACGLSATLYMKTTNEWRLVLLLGWGITYCLLAYGVRGIEQQYRRQLRGQC